MASFAVLPTYSSHPSLRAYLRAVLVAAKDLENIGRYREINGIELYRYVHAFVSSSLTSSFFAFLFSAITPCITAKEASRIFNVIQKIQSRAKAGQVGVNNKVIQPRKQGYIKGGHTKTLLC